MTNTEVSIIVPTYNRRDLISESLESVLGQDFSSFEIIVVDDGSSDGTAEYIRAKYPGVRVIEQVNQGPSAARNAGAKAAKSSILVFFDSDDIMLPNAVSVLVNLLKQYPSAKAAYADHELHIQETAEVFLNHHADIASFQRLKSVCQLKHDEKTRLFESRSLYHVLLAGNQLQQPWAVHRDFFTLLGGFDESLMGPEDWELYLRIARAAPVAQTDEVISIHRLGKSEQHVSRQAGIEKIWLEILLDHLSWCKIKFDNKAVKICHEQMAILYKSEGDQLWEKDPASAWMAYFRSSRFSPLDYVVILRLLLWAPRAVTGLFRRK